MDTIGKVFFLLSLFFFATEIHAQNQFGTVPHVNAEFNIGKSLTVDAKFQSRFLLYQNPLSESSDHRSGFDHTGIQLVLTSNSGMLKDFGAGYLFRWDNEAQSFMHRIIEQYSNERQLGSLSLEHRIRADQTFQDNEAIKYRIRYRLGLEHPLKGVDIDPKECYLVVNNEYVGSFQDKIAHLEIRFLSAIGYNVSKYEQIELGLDYRAGDLLEHSAKNILWLNFGWHYSF